ncbi:30S ribosomal protein S2 [Polluticoccus soli]|uniref:30S ribosomal protein S2 n=1 Tax=Polluticoccus soli TaxID=3034150 RepID=UPI0023E1A07D|nr:30S ribosomal protein S2 [Flavipsychrobacter sp. JY13-12]
MEENKSLHQQLLEAGVHFGHLKKKWNPKMLPYIFAEKNGIHIIDLNKTIEGLDEAAAALKSIAKSGKKIMFVATKKQAKEIVAEAAAKVNMPFVTERWLGGMLTNFQTIRKSVKKMQSIEKMLQDGTMDSVTKKERLTLSRSKEKMEKVLGGISQMGRTPAALFMVDISHEHIALAEAKRLGIMTFAMVDTNSDPTKVDFAIPSNDDATKSIAIIVQYLTAAIMEGLQERSQVKEEDEAAEEGTERMHGLDIDEEGGDKERGERRGRGAGAGAGRQGAGGGAGRGGNRPGGAGNRPGGGNRPAGAGRGPGGGGTRPSTGATKR